MYDNRDRLRTSWRRAFVCRLANSVGRSSTLDRLRARFVCSNGSKRHENKSCLQHFLLISMLSILTLFSAHARAGEPRGPAGSPCDLPPAFAEFDADAVGHNWANAYLLAYLSDVVYRFDVPEAEFEDVFSARIDGLGLEFVDYINRPFTLDLDGFDISGDTQLVVVQTDDAIIFAFRGTDPFTGADLWWTDVNLFTQQGIHAGFNSAADSVYSEIHNHVENAGEREVWLTGHSLGGALAVVTAFNLAFYAPPTFRPQGICTFGAPRTLATTDLDDAVGLYRAFYSDAQTQRWINNRDAVPHIPPTFVPPDISYEHVGEHVWIKPNESETCMLDFVNVPLFGVSVDDHMPDRYLVRIYNTLPAEVRMLMPVPPPLQSGPTEFSCDVLPDVDPPTVWVDFENCTPYWPWQSGAFSLPFCTLQASVDAAPRGACICLKAGVSDEAITIFKPLQLRAHGGSVLIGMP